VAVKATFPLPRRICAPQDGRTTSMEFPVMRIRTPHSAQTTQGPGGTLVNRTQALVLGFFLLVWVSLVVILAAAPEVMTRPSGCRPAASVQSRSPS
jgi:hypothetical protein